MGAGGKNWCYAFIKGNEEWVPNLCYSNISGVLFVKGGERERRGNENIRLNLMSSTFIGGTPRC